MAQVVLTPVPNPSGLAPRTRGEGRLVLPFPSRSRFRTRFPLVVLCS